MLEYERENVCVRNGLPVFTLVCWPMLLYNQQGWHPSVKKDKKTSSSLTCIHDHHQDHHRLPLKYTHSSVFVVYVLVLCESFAEYS